MKRETLDLENHQHAFWKVKKAINGSGEHYLNWSNIDPESIDQVIRETEEINEKTNEAAVILDLH